MSEHDKNLIQGQDGFWQLVIGLEVHAQIISTSKLFSRSSTAFGADPNTQVSFIDAAFPGMLPTINSVCVQQAIKTGLGLNATINEYSSFDRKNYFYPDSPQGYQISQFQHPIVSDGYLDIELEDGTEKRIGIERLHIEQDAGKSVHDQHPQKSYIDLNRCGVALMEIVTRPDIRSVFEAQAYVKKLRALLRALGTCDGNMEQGSLRADINISLCRPSQDYGTRAEIKNVNSIRFMGQAINYEIKRQMELLESGQVVIQETRLFDPVQGVTRSMRSKEDAMDYRYFPDPDLPPLIVSASEIQAIKDQMPELPHDKKKRFMRDFALSSYDAELLINDYDSANFYEAALGHCQAWSQQKDLKAAKMVANWIAGDLFALLNKTNQPLAQCLITPHHVGELVDLIYNNKISGKTAKSVFAMAFGSGHMPTVIVADQGLEQVNDDGAVQAAIDKVIETYPTQVADFKSGKDKILGFLVGMVIKETQGKANPATVNELMRQRLS